MSQSPRGLPPEILAISAQSQNFIRHFKARVESTGTEAGMRVDQVLDLHAAPRIDAMTQKVAESALISAEASVQRLADRVETLSEQLTSSASELLDPVNGVSQRLQQCNAEYKEFCSRLVTMEHTEEQLAATVRALELSLTASEALTNRDFAKALGGLADLVRSAKILVTCTFNVLNASSDLSVRSFPGF